ncbi:MAG: S8 family serine peptidase [Candidatus Sericytochromatia bacterium]
MPTYQILANCLRPGIAAFASCLLLLSCGTPPGFDSGHQSERPLPAPEPLTADQPEPATGTLPVRPLPGSRDFSIKAGGADRLTDSYIVQLSDNTNFGQAVSAAVRGGAKLRHRFPGQHAFSVSNGDPAKLNAISGVSQVTPNFLNSLYAVKPSPSPTPTPAPVQTVPAGVTRIGAAPGSLSFNGSGIGVAVVDGGVSSHRDLNLSTSCFSIDGNCGDQTPSPGHGTHVAGIVAALNNTTDVVGVAPGATIYAVDVFGTSDSTPDDNIIAGLNWIAANASVVSPAIKVVNMSLGRGGSVNDNPALRAAVQSLYNAGITVVVAAGNDAKLVVSKTVPASYPEVLAIASSTALDGNLKKCGSVNKQVKADTASYFTTDGSFVGGVGVTVSAPGASLENLDNGCGIVSEGILSLLPGNSTGKMSGTSMASPHAAGVVALLYQKRGALGLTPEQARSAIRAGAARKGTAPLNSFGSGYSFDGEREGILNAPGALAGV